MENENSALEAKCREGHGSLGSYVIGFIISIVLTLAAYFLVVEQMFAGWSLALALSGLAVGQVLVQLLFFLHLGRESSPPWNLFLFLFMMLIVGILISGTLWIMYNLDYRMMPPMEMKLPSPKEAG